LQKRGVRIFLHLEQIGNFQHVFAAAKALADALAFGIRIMSHEISGLEVCGDCSTTQARHCGVSW